MIYSNKYFLSLIITYFQTKEIIPQNNFLFNDSLLFPFYFRGPYLNHFLYLVYY